MQEERSRQAVLTTTAEPDISLTLTVNGARHTLRLEPRVSLLDALREYLDITGPKKGCNQGACGACTVLVDGERILSCLALAVQYEGREITTIEGLAEGEDLHPLQAAFVMTAFNAGTAHQDRSVPQWACCESSKTEYRQDVRVKPRSSVDWAFQHPANLIFNGGDFGARACPLIQPGVAPCLVDFDRAAQKSRWRGRSTSGCRRQTATARSVIDRQPIFSASATRMPSGPRT